ncbi:MAG: small-conductance mechanosensitive ion channel [Patescibacteria group bacterium]|nr:small-conductance mechanosensitive ion channel [Patescibacteria group bacterium]
MYVAQQGSVYLTSFQSFWLGLGTWLPQALLAIIIFIILVIISVLVGKAVAHLINLTKLDRVFENTGFKKAVNRAGYHFSIGNFIGWLVKWSFILIFLVAFLERLGLPAASIFLAQIVLFLPRVIIAVLILVFGSVLAEFVGKLVAGSTRVANLGSSNFIGTVSRVAIWAVTIIFTLGELGVARDITNTLWTGIVAGLALAFGLAFGLGGRDHAAKMLDKVSNAVANRPHDNGGHM